MRQPGHRAPDSRELHNALWEFIEEVPIGVHWIGPDGAILRVNQAELDLLGYAREETVGRPLGTFHADPEEAGEILRRLQAGEVLHAHEVRLRCRDGTIKPVLLDGRGEWVNDQFVHACCFVRDVSAQRQTERLLRFFSEGDADYTCVARWDGRDLEFEAASAGFARVTGYAVEEFNAQLAAAILHPEDSMTVLQDAERLLSGEGIRNEVRIIRKDGEVRWLRYMAQPLSEPGDARFLRIYGAGQDVTERHEGAERVYEAERRFRQMADSIREAFWLTDPWRTQVLYCSPAFEAIWGRSTESFRQEPWSLFDSVAPEDRSLYAATLERQSRGEPTDVEYRIIRPDGAVRWIRDRSFPVRDPSGAVSRVAGVADDITERKRAEQTNRFLAGASAALAELSDGTSALQRIASLAVPDFADWCAVDIQGPDGDLRRLAVTHIDPARAELARELFHRYPPRPTDPRGVGAVLRSAEPEWAAEIPDALLAELACDPDHRHFLRLLGLKSYLRVPLCTRNGVIGVLSFAMAESGRVYDAGDLRAAEDLANRAVVAIERANLLAELRQADRRKDEFLATLAHELRNPLAPIRNAVYLARANAAAVPELQSAIGIIDRQVQQMARLVDDLLDLSRISQGKITLRPEPVELAAVVRGALEASRLLIEQSGHQLTVSLPPEPIYLAADPTRLTQVLQNLLNNAAKYTPPGGQIWLAAEREDEHLLVRVRDTGVGIAPEMLPRIFEMFTQADRSLESAQQGLGIGLTLVRHLVELHGGTIQASSAGSGQGSEFILRLPVLGRDEGPGMGDETGTRDEGRGMRRDRSPAPPSPRRILVVDDNADAVETMADLLAVLGHEVHTARDGLEAVAAAEAFQPQVILLDIGLPKLNGYEAARQIRQVLGEEVLLIALSGWGQEEDRRRSNEAGFDHHLTKPVDLDALQPLLSGPG